MPTLSLVPEFTYDVTHDFQVLESPPEGIVVHRRPKSPLVPRRIRLVWKTIPRADLDALKSVHVECKGGAGTFTYTPVDEATASDWRFPDQLDWIANSAVGRSVTVEIEEAP